MTLRDGLGSNQSERCRTKRLPRGLPLTWPETYSRLGTRGFAKLRQYSINLGKHGIAKTGLVSAVVGAKRQVVVEPVLLSAVKWAMAVHSSAPSALVFTLKQGSLRLAG